MSVMPAARPRPWSGRSLVTPPEDQLMLDRDLSRLAVLEPLPSLATLLRDR